MNDETTARRGGKEAMTLGTAARVQTIEESQLERCFTAVRLNAGLVGTLDSRLDPVLHRAPTSDNVADQPEMATSHISTLARLIEINNGRLAQIIQDLAI